MKRSHILTGLFSAAAMAVLILDTKTALTGAVAGVKLCLSTLIPSLFPFFLVSILLTSSLMGQKLTLLRPVTKFLRIPEGSESLFLVGLLGGYPVGAQSVSQACQAGYLSPADAKRMLAFCSNAGPAFLFGIGTRIFPEVWMCWMLWAIHIISCMAVAKMVPCSETQITKQREGSVLSPAVAMKKAIYVMATVCGWVIIFKVLLIFCQRWFLWLFPEDWQILISGFFELAGGCCDLTAIENVGTRLCLCSVFLGFGGLCVALQTKSVTDCVDASLYIPGKITQAAISFLMCIPLQLLLPAENRMPMIFPLLAVSVCICLIFIFYTRKIQKNSSFPVPVPV